MLKKEREEQYEINVKGLKKFELLAPILSIESEKLLRMRIYYSKNREN